MNKEINAPFSLSTIFQVPGSLINFAVAAKLKALAPIPTV